ncbi:MAG: Thiamine diphosphokinase [Thermotoga sp. 50_1627]|nr:MAG: Thiamine diphosphokinase [Thermotoga sp. 50_64]KUK24144.1 MAG: Thiamine diphosphokinase [Thermotoga sp. 50_1627]HBT39709.1 thiamine diphosphokinase [Pseudothermotoga sp.]HCO97099.1 thiamine diphosphokinase [Pseudothermotoga sp.]
MRSALFLNGDCEDFEGVDLEDYDLVIAVDGGAKRFLKAGLVPDLFVGDGDSLDESDLNELRALGCEVLLFPKEKDEIDTELALRKAIERGAKEIDIFCWTGERLDMLLALMYLMGSLNIKVTAKSQKLIVGVVSREAELEANPNEKWSIIPIAGDAYGVTLKGFRYEIAHRDMPCEHPYGVSNIAISSRVKISVERGKVAYFRWLKKPS